MNRNRVVVAASLAAIVAMGGWALVTARASRAADDAAAPIAVRAVSVAADAIEAGAPHYAATVRYDREAALSFRLGGRIAALTLRPGDRVGAGGLVAAIEPDAYAANAAAHAADAARTSRDADRLGGLVKDGAVSPAAAAAAHDVADSAAATWRAARYDLASTRLVAPFAAIVLARSAERGETVAPGQVVVRVADSGSALLAVADVPADVAATLRAGMPAQVWSAGAALPGRVRHVAGAADAHSGLVPVEVALDGGHTLISGSPASVSFAAAAAHMAQRLPAEALIDADGARAAVWLIDGNSRAKRIDVRFLGFDDRDALVDGLPPGARVITAGAGFVAAGQRVLVSGS